MPAVAAPAPSAGKLKKERLMPKSDGGAPLPPPPRTHSSASNGPSSGRRSVSSGSAKREAPATAPKKVFEAPPNSARDKAPPAGAKGGAATSKDPKAPAAKGGTRQRTVGFGHDVLDATSGDTAAEPTLSTSFNLDDTHREGSTPEFLKSEESDFGTAKLASRKKADSKNSVDGKFLAAIEKVQALWGSLRKQSQIGSPSDEELKKMEEDAAALERMKGSVAKEILALGSKLAFEDSDTVETLAEFLDKLILETDAKAGNLELLKACMTVFSPAVPFPTMISERQWISNAAADGSIGYIRQFLGLPGIGEAIQDDVQEIVATCCYNQSCRIQLIRTLLEYDPILKLEQHKEDLVETWNEFFADVASKAKAIPREDRNGRMELLGKLLMNSRIGIDVEAEGSDGQTVFSRAAMEGDDELMQLLLSKKKVKDINRVGSDNCTPLILATFGNHLFCVRLLLAQPNIRADHVSQEGTALQIAKALKRHPEITAALETR